MRKMRIASRLTVSVAFGALILTAALATPAGAAWYPQGWTSASSMLTPRSSLAVATALDGRIYAFGGNNMGTITNVVEAYNPATNNWVGVAPMPTPKFGMAAATGFDGRLYVMGGSSSVGATFDIVEAYRPSTNTW